MRIGFIGAGKVGCTLGLYLHDTNDIVGYYSKTAASAHEAATLTGSQVFDSMLDLCEVCDLVFFTTPDGCIGSTWEQVAQDPRAHNALAGTIVAHCSGALSSEVFQGAHDLDAFPYSVHPLFAISSKTSTAAELHQAFFAIEGASEHLEEVMSLFQSLGNEVRAIPTEAKTLYHAAAVMASNHVVALYQLASEQLVNCGFDEQGAQQALAPLFLGNAKHVAEDGTFASLTGPAERGDLTTIAKHLAVLDGEAKEAYEVLNDVALRVASRKHELGL